MDHRQKRRPRIQRCPIQLSAREKSASATALAARLGATSKRKDNPMFTGCGTALVTPFRRDQTIDEAALRRLIRRQIEEGINFLVPCGTTGESPTLSRQEHLRVVQIAVEESNKKVPVLGGAGGYNTAAVI